MAWFRHIEAFMRAAGTDKLLRALMIPTAGRKGFDLVVAVRARIEAAGGMTGRVLRGRIEKETISGLTTYLEWLRNSAAL